MLWGQAQMAYPSAQGHNGLKAGKRGAPAHPGLSGNPGALPGSVPRAGTPRHPTTLLRHRSRSLRNSLPELLYAFAKHPERRALTLVFIVNAALGNRKVFRSVLRLLDVDEVGRSPRPHDRGVQGADAGCQEVLRLSRCDIRCARHHELRLPLTRTTPPEQDLRKGREWKRANEECRRKRRATRLRRQPSRQPRTSQGAESDGGPSQMPYLFRIPGMRYSSNARESENPGVNPQSR